MLSLLSSDTAKDIVDTSFLHTYSLQKEISAKMDTSF